MSKHFFFLYPPLSQGPTLTFNSARPLELALLLPQFPGAELTDACHHA